MVALRKLQDGAGVIGRTVQAPQQVQRLDLQPCTSGWEITCSDDAMLQMGSAAAAARCMSAAGAAAHSHGKEQHVPQSMIFLDPTDLFVSSAEA